VQFLDNNAATLMLIQPLHPRHTACVAVEGPYLRGEEVHVLVGGFREVLRGGLVDDGQHLGVRALAEQPYGAVRTPARG